VTSRAWRLIVEGEADGASNMATDEAMLGAYDGERRDAPPTLRIYGWRPAAISLGRHQGAARAYDDTVIAREGIDVVRRPTGGGAVLHEFERTYAVAGSFGRPPFDGGPVAVYRTIATAIARALTRLGARVAALEPAVRTRSARGASCFEAIGAWEIAAGGRKLVGSAQARRRGAVLQHGSIPIRLEAARLARVLGSAVDGDRFTDLEREAGSRPAPETLDAALIAAFEETFGIDLVPGRASEREALCAAELRCWKYDSIAWTRDGTIGAREARWGPAVGR